MSRNRSNLKSFCYGSGITAMLVLLERYALWLLTYSRRSD